MNTPDIKSLLQTCIQLNPRFQQLIDDSQCTPEQKARVAAISQYILNELNVIRCKLLEMIDRAEANESPQG